MKIVGVDVGGTFTDFFVLDQETSVSFVFKTASTPANPADAIIGGLQALIDQGRLRSDEIEWIGHGTTVATNALLQRRGGKVTLVTTAGFRDLLEIGRQTRPHMYDMQIDHAPPLVGREHRLEADERVRSDGSVLRPLEAAAIETLVERVRESGAEACAVCFLFSFVNPAHEQAIGRALAAGIPGLELSLSSEVQPEFREYERMSTTVLNAYIQPVMAAYLERLETTLGERMPDVAIGINQSAGGLMSVRQARRFPVRTALSGPAGGAVGAAYVAQLAGKRSVITLDMGGTSADVCLIRDYAASIAFESSVGGFPIRLPMVDVNAIGAGGGSIAWFDRDGLLKIGPASAGAAPGPACYGTGGELPTVTDANLILGRLSPHGLLAGGLPLDVGLARSALEPVAARLGFTIERAALGCLDIVVSNMVRAIRQVSVECGHDPRDFSLMAFGGGGPLHAAAVARSLGIREVIVPHYPGVLCAQGLVVSDLKENFVRTRLTPLLESSLGVIREVVGELVAEGGRWFELERVEKPNRSSELVLDVRYVGQNYELSAPVDIDTLFGVTSSRGIESIRAAFLRLHEASYGYQDPNAAIEIVNYRLVTHGRLKKPSAGNAPLAHTASAVARPKEVRAVWFDPSAPTTTGVFARDDLPIGSVIQGPAIIEQMDTTTLLPPGSHGRVDETLNIIVEFV